MNVNDYNKVMSYLDIIEDELNKIAKAFGHPSFDEFFKVQLKEGDYMTK
jgi:hypothetical protein